MDEMIIRSKFMRGLLSRVVSKELRKKLGCDVKIHVDFLQIHTEDKTAKVRLDISGEIGTDDLSKLISNIL